MKNLVVPKKMIIGSPMYLDRPLGHLRHEAMRGHVQYATPPLVENTEMKSGAASILTKTQGSLPITAIERVGTSVTPRGPRDWIAARSTRRRPRLDLWAANRIRRVPRINPKPT